MIKRLGTYGVLLIFLLLLNFSACRNVDKYSEVPEIELISTEILTSVDELGNEEYLLEIFFSVVDGDGDIGLSDADTSYPYVNKNANNFFPHLYIKTQGEWILSDSLGVFVSAYRIPYVGDLGQYPVLKANVRVDVIFSALLNKYEYLKCEFYIVDRQLHESNKIITPDIVLKQNNS